MKPHTLILASPIVVMLVAGAGSAAAAPQVLGVVASNGQVPLICDSAGCRGELSTFCLQQPRANPEPGQQYTLVDGRSIAVVGRTASGEAVRLPAGPFMTFVSERGFTAVQVSVPGPVLARIGLQSVSVEVADGASLLPVAQADDPDPQSADEVSLATGPLRAQGAKFFDATGESGDAIRLANVMINSLPGAARRPGDSDGHILDAALRSDAARVADPTGVALARGLYSTCVTKVDVTHHIDSMRTCLQGSHDRLVANTNVDFWESLGSY